MLCLSYFTAMLRQLLYIAIVHNFIFSDVTKTIIRSDSEILVIELKKGKAVDTVVGQCLRYMGFVKTEVAEEGQTVSGMIIASEDSKKIRYALSQTSNIDFYTYKIDFQLSKQN